MFMCSAAQIWDGTADRDRTGWDSSRTPSQTASSVCSCLVKHQTLPKNETSGGCWVLICHKRDASMKRSEAEDSKKNLKKMKTCSVCGEFSRQWDCRGWDGCVREMKEQNIWKQGENAAEQSRSQAAGKDHLGARCVSFVSSPLQLSLLSSPPHCSSPYSDKTCIQTETQKLSTLMKMC